LLRLDSRLAVGPDNVDWNHTTVYARSGLGAVYVNREGKGPPGGVPASSYEAFREKVIAHFSHLRGPKGKYLFSQIWRGEELYPRAHAEDRPPDIVLRPAEWRDHMITGYPQDPLVRDIPEDREYGTHSQDGILVLAGDGVRTGVDLGLVDIVDVTPTLLAGWDLPIPDEVDGRVLETAFYNSPRQCRVSRFPVRTREGRGDESLEVLERLRGLGYLG
jgi:predicted AlkP superfamily phosphohydrolase/phosphomutase